MPRSNRQRVRDLARLNQMIDVTQANQGVSDVFVFVEGL